MPTSRVLVQLHSLRLGGTEVTAVDLARAVRRHGYESVLFGPADTLPAQGPSILEVADGLGVRIETYDRSPTVSRGGARRLTRRADAMGADIVHVYGINGEPRCAYWGPSRLGRRALVHTVYEMGVDPDLYRHTCLVVGTGYLRDELADRPGPTALVSPPVDLERDAPDEALASGFRRGLGELAGRTLVVVVSRLDREMKAFPVETAIRATAALRDTDIGLVVVGDGEERARLARLAECVNASAGRRLVSLVGALADPRPAYAAADVCLGMGSSAARALAFARPLVVQGERGSSELFEPTTAHDLFHRSFWSAASHPGAVLALADLLRPLVADPARRARLGAFGREFAARSFGLEAMAERLAGVYAASLASYGPAAWSRDLRLEAPRLSRFVRDRVPWPAGGSR